MSDALNLLTRGLHGISGLSLTTRGLIFELEVGAVEAEAADLMTDVALAFTSPDLMPDIAVADGRLVAEHGLTTAVVLSLFVDRLAEADDPLAVEDGDRRGWWGDVVPPVVGDRIGSRLWLLWREKQTQATRLRAEEYVREALAWMLEDQIASEIVIESAWLQPGVLAVGMGIERPADPNIVARLSIAWEGMR